MKSHSKKIEKITILNNEKNHQMNSNELNFKRRTLENNTFESIEDQKLKRITTWRKSRSKFISNLKYNILSFGILHLISLYYPNLYIKLYCNPWPAKECDFFLVENIYGQCTLCVKIHKKRNNNDINSSQNIDKEKVLSPLNDINRKSEYNIIKNLTYSFTYKSVTYEYNEDTNEIIPVYINLSNMTNKGIINFFGEGLHSEQIVKKFEEKYGKNVYNINIKLPIIYFRKVEVPSFILVLVIGLIEFCVLKDYVSLFIKSFVILIIFIIQFVSLKKSVLSQYKKENTLDGEKNKIKVKRKYLIKNNNFFEEINNKDLLPGDIIYLKTNDFVPCDCILIEGDCIVNESNLNGSLNVYKKLPLENNTTQFNYLINNINILLHGMKIIKTFSKLNNGFISALCINTGPNTYKANQYSNILYFLERKKEYNEVYNFFGNRKKIIFIYMVIVFFLSLIFGFFYFKQFKLKINKEKASVFLYKILIRSLCKCLMAVFFITHSIMILLNIYRLRKENIICFDKSRLLNSGKINTIFFNKTGTLSYDNLGINSYHPIIFNQKTGNITYKNYYKSQCKEMNMLLLKYYREYIINRNNFNNPNFNPRLLKIQRNELVNKENNKYNKYIILFLECLLCCNNLEKYSIELFGNNIEIKLFNDFNWNLEINDYNNNYNIEIKNILNDDKYNLYEKRIIDIFPKNYYKITESSKTEVENLNKIKGNNNIYKINYEEQKNDFQRTKTMKKKDNYSIFSNEISENINNFDINSYKLRIFKKFIKNGTLNSSAIVYNFITKELRFMIKGMPEDILDKCDKNSIPENLDDYISFYRRNGLIIIVCASKKINIEEYNDSNSYNYYMNDLTFCGFITLKNKLKENIINSIQYFKKCDYNLIITSGDNEYNCISLGFNCDIIGNKNIFRFEKDDDLNKIKIKKLYTSKNYIEEIKANCLIDKNSKTTSKINNNYNLNYNALNQNDIKNENPSSPRMKKRAVKMFSKKKSKLETENSEKEKINISPEQNFFNNKIEDEKNSFINLADITPNKNISKRSFKNINQIQNSNISTDYKEYLENNNFKRNKTNFTKKNESTNNKNISYRETLNYHPKIFKDFEELNDNCIFCISGKTFDFLYNNQNIKEYKYLLNKIYKNCKIFYNMSSINKTYLVDFYRQNSKNYICNIGENESDIDSIIYSNIGINFKNPNNQNTILYQFYSNNNDISCIKKIISEGKVLYENTLLLEFISFLCTMALNSFIICCLIRNVDVFEGQLNFLEIEFLVLSISSFTGQPKNNFKFEPLAQNEKLLKIYYYVNLFFVLLMKLLCIFFFSSLYKSDIQIKLEKRDKIYVTYYFILNIEFIICIVFSFNYISFFRKSPFSNLFLKFFALLMVLYILILITLNSSNFRYDFFDITVFEFSPKLIDSFGDKNRIWLILLSFFDFISSILFSTLIYYIFDKIAKNRLSIKKNNNNVIKKDT